LKIQFNNAYLTIFESCLYRTTSSVIDLGDTILITDPNWLPHEISFIQQWIKTHHSGKKQCIFFTHSDYDHIIGWKAFPKAKVITSDVFVQNPKKTKILNQIRHFDQEYYINRDYVTAYPDTDIVISKNPHSLIIDNTEMIFFPAKGHVRDGLFVVIPSLNIWIAGDYLSNIEIPMIDHDLNAYQKTLATAYEINKHMHILYMIPGHGDLAIGKEAIQSRIDHDLHYLRMLKQNPDPKLVKQFVSTHYSDNPVMMKIHRANMKKI
jgi:hydroxyacylglutathione hydrolase